MSKPIQYQKGYVEFYKLKFRVTPDVLIPRPETELLVDQVLSYLQATNYKLTTTIIDLGTGSGNVAISIAKQLPTWNMGIQIIATDVSVKALTVAKQNAKLHGVQDRITFIQSNLLNVIARNTVTKQSILRLPRSPRRPRNDRLIIVTNLPYIPSARIPYLDSSVKDYEPHVALDGGEDGFALYRKLFAQIRKKDRQPNFLIGEIDYTHGELAVNEALKFFPDTKVEVKTDLAHKQRILTIDWVIPAK